MYYVQVSPKEQVVGAIWREELSPFYLCTMALIQSGPLHAWELRSELGTYSACLIQISLWRTWGGCEGNTKHSQVLGVWVWNPCSTQEGQTPLRFLIPAASFCQRPRCAVRDVFARTGRGTWPISVCSPSPFHVITLVKAKLFKQSRFWFLKTVLWQVISKRRLSRLPPQLHRKVTTTERRLQLW